ncbi:MAG: AbgT family transporter [Deltaproteobacteria bacterium]|nr:AbgT family transporter [Deltaproteobacteria bacterium]
MKKYNKKQSGFMKFLDSIEKAGNALPHPATLFAILALLVAILSFITYHFSISAIHPTTGEKVIPFNLVSGDGLSWIYISVTKNFVMFPPFGIVLVAMVGIGVAEGSGLIEALIRQSVIKAPSRLVTPIIVAAGIISHLASSVGYVVLIPLGAMVFMAFKRHPIAGLSAAFVGVSGGFGANFLIGSIDPILSGLSESAAKLILPEITINPAVNFYFMFVSACMIVFVGTFVTEKIVEPRLGIWNSSQNDEIILPTIQEKRGLIYAGVAAFIIGLLFLVLVIPENGLLRGTGRITNGPFFKGLITAILVFFFIPGLVYGITTGKIKNDRDVISLVTTAMKGIAPYIVLVFFASQFVFWFRESRLGIILAIKGAALIKSSGMSGVMLILIFILFSGILNMFMGSASAKWAIMAPVFVPMFMLSGYHPALTQAAFRIGDSVTNIITPMMSYFALILTYVNKYDKDAGIGTMISIMLPYTVFLSFIWTLLLVVWYLLGIPLGPGGPLHM